MEPKLYKYYKQNFLDNTYMICDFDVVIKRNDNKYYNSYKIINNKIIFYSDLPIQKTDVVKILEINRIENDLVVKLAKCEISDGVTKTLTVVSYKPPLDVNIDIDISNSKGIDPLFMFIDVDSINSKLSFLLCVDSLEKYNNLVVNSKDFELKFALGD